MRRKLSTTLTISPPNLERTGYFAVEQALTGRAVPVDRDWLISRFHDGLQVRMLRPPARGLIEFSSGLASWHPIEGAERCVVVQCLHSGDAEGAALLIEAAEDWARYFGFSALLVLTGPHPRLPDPQDMAALEYRPFGDTADEIGLMGKILHGPILLPSLPQGWGARARALGPGLVVQCSARCPRALEFAQEVTERARQAGHPARVDLIETPRAARSRRISAASDFAIALDGDRLDDGRLSEAETCDRLRALLPDA
jgi:hypothetical protein